MPTEGDGDDGGVSEDQEKQNRPATTTSPAGDNEAEGDGDRNRTRRIVNSENRRLAWLDQVQSDPQFDDSWQARYILSQFANPTRLLNKNLWAVKFRAKKVADAVGVSKSTFYNYWDQIKESGYLERIGTHTFETGRGEDTDAVFQLVYYENGT